MQSFETPSAPDLSPVITFGQVSRTVVEHRRIHDMTQVDLAEAMGITSSWVSRIEHGLKPLELRNRRHLELLFAHMDALAAAGADVTETAGELKAA